MHVGYGVAVLDQKAYLYGGLTEMCHSDGEGYSKCSEMKLVNEIWQLDSDSYVVTDRSELLEGDTVPPARWLHGMVGYNKRVSNLYIYIYTYIYIY